MFNNDEGVHLTQQSSSRFPKRTSGSANITNPSTWTFFRGSMKTWNIYVENCGVKRLCYVFQSHQMISEKCTFRLEQVPDCLPPLQLPAWSRIVGEGEGGVGLESQGWYGDGGTAGPGDNTTIDKIEIMINMDESPVGKKWTKFSLILTLNILHLSPLWLVDQVRKRPITSSDWWGISRWWWVGGASILENIFLQLHQNNQNNETSWLSCGALPLNGLIWGCILRSWRYPGFAKNI